MCSHKPVLIDRDKRKREFELISCIDFEGFFNLKTCIKPLDTGDCCGCGHTVIDLIRLTSDKKLSEENA